MTKEFLVDDNVNIFIKISINSILISLLKNLSISSSLSSFIKLWAAHLRQEIWKAPELKLFSIPVVIVSSIISIISSLSLASKITIITIIV